ncbi:TetR/AcrR family transcriptional regulator (plasmid) [Bacillus sp. F19]|nr:TetR/AcrR family transcriptional regulator [Bacillus sp. F19]
MMVSNQERRSDKTKKMILIAAGKLFSKKGYDSVTMREIAKEAGCSHTTIYLYFKDKVTLLHQLSMPSLQELQQQLKKYHLLMN